MKKIIAYKTEVELTANIINDFSDSINKYIKGWTSTCVHMDEFFKNGIPNDTNAIVTLGILRGTGELLKEAARIELDRYYIDHAYFQPGYSGDCWLRISKNKHTVNYLKDVSGFRWDSFFSKKHSFHPWKNYSSRGKTILIIPPTSAIAWYFNENEWEKNILSFLKENLSDDLFKKIKIRTKPNEPIVDMTGKYLGLKQNSTEKQVPIEEDLENASIIIAYNSQVALQATLMGMPVIVNQHNSCFGISFKLSDLLKGLDNPIFEIEPERIKLVKWLSYCQFKLSEIKNGFAWKTINNFQN